MANKNRVDQEADDDDYQKAWHERPTGLSVIEGALAVTSTSLGSGIISVPYAMTVHGLKFAVTCHIIMQVLMLLSTYLYMKAREVYKVDSHSDLCFMCFGRKSVYIGNFVNAFVIFIVMILFLVMFS